MPCAKAQDRIAALRPLLPVAGARILVAEPDSPGLALGLKQAGYSVTAAADDLPGASMFDAAVFLDADRATLTAFRPRLANKAPVLVIGHDDARDATVALSESGFVVVKMGDVLEARKEPFFVRAYRPGDEAQILPMFRRSFGVERDVDRFRWEYEANPYSNRTISVAFDENGRLVAHYAGYAVRFHSESRGMLAALHVGDTMTEPSVRHIGRGSTSLLGRTVRHFYARFCERRVAFNFGVNTGNIQRFSTRFVGARRLEDLPYGVRDAREPMATPRSWLDCFGGWRVERVRSFDARWDDLFRRVRGAYRLLIERDARYLEWRYARCPDVEYFVWAVFRRDRLVGWSVFRHRGERGDRLAWGDALFDPAEPAALPRLLAHVLAAPEHRAAERVETWLASRPAWWSERVRALGWVSRPEPQGLGFVFVPFAVDPEDDFRADLYYTMGDSDLF